MNTVTIIDYGIGNLRSIEKAFQAVGADVLRTDRAEDIDRAERVVLPGVGAFGACAAEIRRRSLVAPILDAVASGKPFLGVCVGMQLLFEVGEEMGEHRGLSILPGRVVRFARQPTAPVVQESAHDPLPAAAERPLKIPHMGWNQVMLTQGTPLLRGLAPGSFFYFVHSYHALPSTPGDVLATTDYGGEFPAVVGRNNVFGVQFHPEKSQQSGLLILNNFAMLTV